MPVRRQAEKTRVDGWRDDVCRAAIVPRDAFLHMKGVGNEMINARCGPSIPGAEIRSHGAQASPAEAPRITVVEVIGQHVPDVAHRSMAVANLYAPRRFPDLAGHGSAAAY